MIKLLIFDLDGTLVDSAPGIIKTTNTLMASRGKPPLPPERIIAAIGEGLKQTIFSLFPETHSDPIESKRLEEEFFLYYERNLLLETKVYPGVDQFLSACELKIAIVSNKHAHFALKTVEGLSLCRYPWLKIFGADSLPLRKPDPLPLLEVMRAAEVERSETIMIGDGIPDMIAARRAGVHSIAVEFGYTPTETLRRLGASSTLAAYKDLALAIRAIEALPPATHDPTYDPTHDPS